MRIVLCLLFLLATSLSAQEGPKPSPKFTINQQLVVETVSVKDKSGKPIEDLSASDFTVTEDGAPQQIKFFEFQKLDEKAPRLSPSVSWVPTETSLTQTQIAAEPPGTLKYSDRRLLVLYFDMSAMSVRDQLRSVAATQAFIAARVTAVDLVSVMVFDSGALRILEDFTDDRAHLMGTLNALSATRDTRGDANSLYSGGPDASAAFGQDDSEFNIFNTDRQLSALQTAARALSHISERKLLIYFAGGIQLNGLDNQAQLHATINEAVRAGVAFYPIDTRGLVAQAPIGDATRGSPGGAGPYTGSAAFATQGRLQRSQDTLWTLAEDTGGKAFLDNNDLAKGVIQAQQSLASYYVIGYYTSNETLDGKYRRVKVTVNGRRTATLDYRRGYFAGKLFPRFSAADKERQLEDALMLADPITELTIAMEIDYFQMNNAEYFVPVAVKIPGRELALARHGGAERTLIDFLCEIKDEFGTTVTNSRDKIDVKLNGASAVELLKRPIQYDTGFTLLPGNYVIKFLARDAETGRIGTYQTPFVVPNLNDEDGGIPISSVVLSSQKLDLKDALYTVRKSDETVNPLVLNGQKLIPNVTRVFSKSRDVHFFLQAYEHGITVTHSLVIFASFYSGQARVLETRPIEVTDSQTLKFRAVPLRFSASLAALEPGQYFCQITVLDPAQQKATFWRAPVIVVP
jgi:VWFA-related protein